MSTTVPTARRLPPPTTYAVTSELVTFTGGPSAGQTELRWEVADGDGHRVSSGIRSEADAHRTAAARAAGDRPVVVPLKSGRLAIVPTRMDASFLGLDEDGYRVTESPIGPVALTACCCATGTGGVTGVECRVCHRTVAWYFGGDAKPVVDARAAAPVPPAEDPHRLCLECAAAYAPGERADEPCAWSYEGGPCHLAAVELDDAALAELGLI